MEGTVHRSVCSGCLATSESLNKCSYTAKDSALIAASNSSHITLCAVCRIYARVTERFLENVRLAQALLDSSASLQDDDFHDSICEAQLQLTKICDLKRTVTHNVDIDGRNQSDDDCVSYFEMEYGHGTVSVKEESRDSSDVEIVSDEELFDNDAFEVRIIEVKPGQLESELLEVIKQEPEERLQTKKERRERRGKRKIKNINDNVRVKKVTGGELKVEGLFITQGELEAECDRMRLERPYANALYKCESCIKGYAFRETYDRHMDLHSEKFGSFTCDICGRRSRTAEQLSAHRGGHYRRYRCTRCGYTRATRQVVAEHYAAEHARELLMHCALCPKFYLKRTLLKKHIAYAHSDRKRPRCEHCNKTYANAEVLRSHINTKHSDKERTALEHACDQCERAFKFRSHLNAHMLKHTDSREYYCVECDRYFKSQSILRQHLKTAQPHVDSKALPLGCDHCEVRFAGRREQQRHINKLHLNIKPYKCDQCDKTYSSPYSMQIHRRVAHEGYKRPLRFPCTMCDKIFNRGTILKSHLRTHTGERPYQCTKCPATFTQSGVLHTHNRLIHLKLQRNGEPRAGRFRRTADYPSS